MVIALRALARVVGFLTTVALAVIGAAVALFSIQGGETGLSVPALAELLDLPALGRTLDGFRSALEGDGPIAAASALGGLAAIFAGVMLIAGVLAPRRPRVFTLADDEAGSVAAQRRPLARIATALVLSAEGVTRARVRARPGRRRRGRLRVTADRTRRVTDEQVKPAIGSALAPVTEAFDMRTRVKTEEGRGGARVQ